MIETKEWIEELRREWKLTDQFPEMALEAAFRYFYGQGAKGSSTIDVSGQKINIVSDPNMSPGGWRLEKNK